MSEFKASFTLKQHTPIIHFQSGQSGATLRATELKPKLDRFLIKKEPTLKTRKNSNGHLSLDYKVTLATSSFNKNEINQRDPLFFGNMKPKDMNENEFESTKKYFVSNESVKIEFFSFDKDILTAINKHAQTFFSMTNFGTRQSKGFGSYSIDGKFDKSNIPYKVYSFKSSRHGWAGDVRLFYGLLRSGINAVDFQQQKTTFYAKALSFMYAKKQGWIWDKKAIKQAFFINDLEGHQKKYPDKENCINFSSSEKHIIRDLFGLSTDQSWKSYNASIKKESKPKDTITRFKSPITFKPIFDGNDATIYFWADNSVEDILDKSFKVTSRSNSLELATPKKFSFEEFFDYAFDIDLSKHIAQQYHDQKEFTRLNKIFSDIKAGR